jgi:hypothetical protein
VKSFVEETPDRIARLRRNDWRRHRDGIEAERLGGRDERRLRRGGRQKSRSA